MFSFQIDRFTQETDVKTVNQADTRYQIGTNDEYGGANFSYLFSDHINKDFVAGQTRDQKVNAATLGDTGNSLWADSMSWRVTA
jgi:outer membrane protein W